MHIRWILIFMFASACWSSTTQAMGGENCGGDLVVKGEIDLDCPGARDIKPMNGRWQLDYVGHDEGRFSGLAPVPLAWSQINTDPPISQRGTGEYSLRFRSSRPVRSLALDLPRFWSAKSVALEYPDGHRVILLDTGVGLPPEQVSRSRVADVLIPLPDIIDGTRLIVGFNAVDTIFAGMWAPPELGDTGRMLADQNRRKLLALGAVAILLVFAAINLSLWSSLKRDRVVLVLAIASISAAVRQLVTAGILYDLLPWLSIAVDAFLSWTTFFVGVIAGFYFVYLRYENQLDRWILWVPFVPCVVGILLLVFFPLPWLQHFGVILRPVIIVSLLLLIFQLMFRADRSDLESSATLFGIYLLLVGACVDIAYFHLYQDDLPLSVFAVAWVAFVCSQTVFLSRRYKASIQENIALTNELKQLNNNLESTVRERTEELKEKNRQLERISRTDPLTNLYNRRALEDMIQKELERYRRTGSAWCLVLLDLDHFKKVNDRWGHQCGDRVLIAVAQCLQENLRDIDVLARWGGEEFCVVMPDTDRQQAVTGLTRLRERVSRLRIVAEPDSDNDETISLTISIGATIVELESGLDSLIKQADDALYSAKKKGRNRLDCAWNL